MGGSCGHGSTVWGQTMFVFGGLDAKGTSAQLHALDLDSMVWTEIPRRPSGVWPPARALIQHSMSNFPGGFFVASGTSSEEADDESAYVYNASRGTWSRISRGQGAQTQVGGSVAVYAGA